VGFDRPIHRRISSRHALQSDREPIRYNAKVPAVSREAEILQLEPALRAFAIRATRNPELARDLVQETLLSATTSAAAFDGRSKLRTWVLGILAHKVLDHFRSAAVRGEDPDGEAALLETPSTEDVERVAIARQSLERVERALGELPDKERLAILLTDVEGLDRREVCHVLEVSPTHLRVLLHRGRNRLRRLLEAD
jgi:RNA polymerase sigma-70 factor (ECF subfamily)